MNLNLLIALHVLLTERSVTRAAERMHVTQPAMSGMLARLRDSFGDPLLVRVGRESKLTPLAESLVDQLREIAARVDTIVGSRAGFSQASTAKHFVIMASDYVARILLAEVMRRTAVEAPGATFEIVPIYGGMGRDLEDGKIDLLITTSHFAVAPHPRADLFDDSYQVLACKAGDALRSGKMTLKRYQSASHVLYQDRRDIKPWFDQWYENQFGNTRKKSVITNNYALIPHFLIGTNRISTVQARLASSFQSQFDLAIADLPLPMPRVKFVLQWHRFREHDPALEWLRETISKVAEAMP